MTNNYIFQSQHKLYEKHAINCRYSSASREYSVIIIHTYTIKNERM